MATKHPCDILVFDASNAAHRISAASPALTNQKGERVEVIFGLLRLLSASLRENPSRQLWMVWDTKTSKVRRAKLDPDYKSNRHKNEDKETELRLASMYDQRERFWEKFGQYLPIMTVDSERHEADDIMSMIAHQAVHDGKTCTLVTGDKDLWQLVDLKGCTVYSPNKQYHINARNFKEVSDGFPTGQDWLHAKCLMGDSSDNIKGIGGVAEKTAFKMLSSHGFDFVELTQRTNNEIGKTTPGKKLQDPSVVERINLNYSLMSLSAPVHQKGLTEKSLSKMELKKGKPNPVILKTWMAKNQFASLIVNFTNWYAPFKALEV